MFGDQEVAVMVKAGVDAIAAHVGLTTGGVIGAQDSPLAIEKCAQLFKDRTTAAHAHHDDLNTHSRPLAEPEDARKFLDLCPDYRGFTAYPPSNDCLLNAP